MWSRSHRSGAVGPGLQSPFHSLGSRHGALDKALRISKITQLWPRALQLFSSWDTFPVPSVNWEIKNVNSNAAPQPWTAERCSWWKYPSLYQALPTITAGQRSGNTANSYHLTILLPVQSTFPIGQLHLSRGWDIPQGPTWWRGRRWPRVQWGWESCGGQPPVSTLLPHYHQAGESGGVTDLQGFHKEAEMQGFWCPPPL